MAQLSDTLYDCVNWFIKALLYTSAARAALLILNFPIAEIPYLDDALFAAWRVLRELFAAVNNSRLLPRFG